MTKNKASLRQLPTGRGQPSICYLSQYSTLREEMQPFLNPNAPDLHEFSTIRTNVLASGTSDGTDTASLTETQPVGKGQMSQFALKIAEQFCLHIWQSLIYLVFTRLYVRVDTRPYAAIDPEVLAWLESGARYE